MKFLLRSVPFRIFWGNDFDSIDALRFSMLSTIDDPHSSPTNLYQWVILGQIGWLARPGLDVAQWRYQLLDECIAALVLLAESQIIAEGRTALLYLCLSLQLGKEVFRPGSTFKGSPSKGSDAGHERPSVTVSLPRLASAS